MELANHFLIAMPNSDDYSPFAGSVVYITEHSSHIGAIGVVINKVVSRGLADTFSNVKLSDYNNKWEQNNLYWGGPVGENHGFFLLKDEVVSVDGYRLTGDRGSLKELSRSNTDLFMSVGFSLWSPFQLESEIRQNSWIVTQSAPELIFKVDPEVRYEEALKIVGVNRLSSLYCNNDILTAM